MRTSTLILAGAAHVASAAACNVDPAHTSVVDALGSEAPGVPAGPFHRAGQPCVACHGTEGPASRQLVIAGTVFYGPGETSPPAFVGVGNAQVVLEDDSQAQHTVTTNCVGNFYVQAGEWPGHPQFPVLVRVVAQPQQTMFDVAMQSHIGREGSCASCHQVRSRTNAFETPGVIHLAAQDDATFLGDSTCPVSPVLRLSP